MFKQKGFVASPTIILVIAGLLAALVINNTYSNRTQNNQLDLTKFEQSSKSPTATTTPIPIANSSDLINPVKQFYSDLSTKQYYDAWTLLSTNFQNYAQNYDIFSKGYTSTEDTTIKNISVQDLSNNIVRIEFDATDKVNGQIKNTSYAGTWKLVYENNSWKLDEANIVALNLPNPTQILTPNNTSITHNGTRTGKIIDYLELATGRHISIYENELLPYTINGKQTFLTKGDIVWYEKTQTRGLCGDYKAGTNEYSNCLTQWATSLGVPAINPNSNASSNQWPKSQYQPIPVVTQPPEFGKGYITINPSISGNTYTGYDSAGNSVYLKPNSLTGGLSGTDSNGNYIDLRPNIGGTQLQGSTNQGSYYLRPNTLNGGFNGIGY